MGGKRSGDEPMSGPSPSPWQALVAMVVVLATLGCEPRPEAWPSGDSMPVTPAAMTDLPKVPRVAGVDTSAGVPKSAPVPSRRPRTPRAEVPAELVENPGPVSNDGPRRVFVGTEDLTGIGYDMGSRTAPVIVVEFSDFGCPYCAEFALNTFPAIDREFIRTGKVFFKYVPFIAGSFRNSAEATRAAECVGEQGPFWLMVERLSETQPGWKLRGSPDGLLRTVARSTKVDSAQYAACYTDRHTELRTKVATDIANRVGVWVTPSFVVNDKPVQGALPLAEFRKVINQALASVRKSE